MNTDISGMILTRENRSAQRETCPSATLCVINPTWTGLGSNTPLRDERRETNYVSHGRVSRVSGIR
jgi:hypothetical protein